MKALSSLVGLLISAGISLSAIPSQAAQTVHLSYQNRETSLSINELTTFGKTGELSERVERELRAVNQKPEDLQSALTHSVEMQPAVFSQLLNSFVGQLLLNELSQAIHTPHHSSDRQFLRTALREAAASDGEFSLLEVLQHYPVDEVYIEGDRINEVSDNVKSLLRWVPGL